MSRGGPILILTASAGAGHTVAAHALADAFSRQSADIDIEIHDVLQSTNKFFRTLYAQGYLALVNHAPTAMGLLYEATDRPDHRLRDSLRWAFQDLNSRRAKRYLLERRPRLIVNTHFLSAEIVAHLRRERRLDCPQATVTTDFETHRLWVQAPTERYYTATDEGRAYLTACGAPADCIRVSGIPVRAAFEQAPSDRAALRSQLGLHADEPVVLLLCGGFGVGPTEALLLELSSMRAEVQIAVVTGRNKPLQLRLERVAQKSRCRVVVTGFTTRMHDWMHAADVLVTKPGGLTASEALVCGLPMVIVNPIPGQEARNSDYLLEHGAALKVNNVRMLGHRVGQLLAEPGRLEALRRAAQAIARPGAAKRIASDALALLETDAGLTPAQAAPRIA
jgi:processive 1,2-diacylglycerol beta-glucosyltransferase